MATARERDDAQQVVDAIKDDYMAVRVLPDGSVAAIGKLVYTTALFLDCDLAGYSHRFCFEDEATAWARFNALQSANDNPPGYIARR